MLKIQFNKSTVGPMCVTIGQLINDIDEVFARKEMTLIEALGVEGEAMKHVTALLNEAKNTMEKVCEM